MNKFLVLSFALCLLVALAEAHSAQVVPALSRLRRDTERCQGSKEMQNLERVLEKTSTKLKKHLSGRKDEKHVDHTMKQFYTLLAKVKEVC
ncbi:hypothetical protein MBRA1_000627 [Malassezia brasiliensis]|uniref:Eosinophil differentiation factor n=1 Tax=Malassezia brasiliensis TaxID=1821822 RepID=A0AAF0DTU6_9BASI|nr:hypothetical protein MBRA1_000627 [Malassezia brasiliensis]